MAYIYDLGCLYSTVKNISGGTLRFGFLPPHGKEPVSYTHLTLPTNREV